MGSGAAHTGILPVLHHTVLEKYVCHQPNGTSQVKQFDVSMFDRVPLHFDTKMDIVLPIKYSALFS